MRMLYTLIRVGNLDRSLIAFVEDLDGYRIELI